MNEILLNIAKQYYFEGATDETWEENKHLLEPGKKDIKQYFLDLLKEAKEHGAPLTWLESEINKL